MDFRRFNEWKTDQLLMALKENNTKELEYLRKKKDSFLLSYLFNADFGKISLPMMEILVNKFTDENWERWGAKPGRQKDIVVMLMKKSMQAGRTDLFNVFFDTSPDLNNGEGENHVIGNILVSQMPAETKMEFIGKIAERGLDKVTNLQSLAVTAHTVNLPAPANLGSVSLPPGGPFQLKLTGTAAAYYEIQSNTNLNFTNWTTVAFITNSGGMTVFNDPSATNRPQTFYRAIAR